MQQTFCSVIIPTIGRPTLERAVRSVLQQTNAGALEVIVVNDSGAPLPTADWQSAEKVTIINTNCRERSVARNTGAALAKGRYLHFLDDDDWLASDALKHLWDLAQREPAGWLYGATQLVARDGQSLLRLQHQLNGNCFVQVMSGEWIPLQSSMIDSQLFFAVGGFNPNLAGPEDIDLLRRIALHGDVAETDHTIAYLAIGDSDTTTDYDQHPQASRRAREIILDHANTFARLRGSAGGSSWHGRIARIYLTSAVWNLRHRRLGLAVSRLLYGVTSIFLAGSNTLSRAYWRALLTSYRSETFARGSAIASSGS